MVEGSYSLGCWRRRVFIVTEDVEFYGLEVGYCRGVYCGAIGYYVCLIYGTFDYVCYQPAGGVSGCVSSLVSW